MSSDEQVAWFEIMYAPSAVAADYDEQMDDPSARDISMMMAAATAFYLEDKSKVQIADDLGLTRFKVARMLSDARDLGIVQIEVRDPFNTREILARRLVDALNLKSLVLVPDASDLEAQRAALALEGGRVLATSIEEGMAIGVSWGRTLLGLGVALGRLPKVDLVQLMGLVGTDPTQSPLQIMASLNSQSEARSHALLAPLFASSANSAMRLRAEPAIQKVLEWYNHLDIAVLSIGAWRERITQLDQHFTDSEAKQLDELDVIADCAGLFFDERGVEVKNELTERRISISVDQLRRTPNVVAIAGGEDKAESILAVARSGILNILVTTVRTAIILGELLELPLENEQSRKDSAIE